MPTIGRADPGGSSNNGGRQGPRRKTVKHAKAKAGARASNWFAAQMRQARLRVMNAFRLAGAAVVVIVGGVIAIYAVMGRLDEAGAALLTSAENRLTNAGYVVSWVDVVGAQRLAPEEVADLIGVEPGTGLVALDLNEAQERLEANSWVERAELMRLWPDRVVVRLVERDPYALWQSEGEHAVVDRNGVVIEAADPISFANLPRVVGPGANEDAQTIVALLESHPAISERTTHALYVGERRWSLRLRSGGEVLLPEADPASALVLLAGMHRARGVLDYDAQILDLRNPGEMVMRPWPDRAAQAAGRGA